MRSLFQRKSKEVEEQRLNYVCINCGADVRELYKQYSSTVLKIIQCQNCNEIADKYIEFETIIVVIDLILLSQAAYRHVLFNTECKNLWKLGIILILLESYCLWVETFNGSGSGSDRMPRFKDPFTTEKGFYLSCLEIVFGNFLLYTFTWVLSQASLNKQDEETAIHPERNFSLDLLRALTLASIGKFFFLPIMIWKDNSTPEGMAIHLSLVIIYFVLSMIHAHSVVAHCSRQNSAFIIILAFVSKTIILMEVHLYMKGQIF